MDYDIISEPDPNQLPAGDDGHGAYNDERDDVESNRGGYDRYDKGNDRSYSRGRR